MMTFTRWLMIALLAATTTIPATLHAQVLQSLPNLTLTSPGDVRAILRQNDGSMIVGGGFQSINGQPRSNIARLLPDGSLDPVWNPDIGGAVYALAQDADGAILVGGRFAYVDGVLSPNLAKLASGGDGSIDPTWSPAPNGPVFAMAVSGFTLYIGGLFTDIDGVARQHIGSVLTPGAGAVLAWNPGADRPVYALSVVDPLFGDDFVIAGGFFTQIGGQARNHLAKLSVATGNAEPGWNPSPNSAVYSLANDGTFVFAGGEFTQIGAQPRARLARIAISGPGQPVAGWTPAADGTVRYLGLSSPNLYVGGNFTSIGSTARGGVARLSAATGALDAAWDPGAAGAQVNVVRTRSDGVIYVGGAFRTMAGQPRLSLARLDANAASTVPTDIEFPGQVYALARQADGAVIAGGNFAKANGQPRGNLLRLRADGLLDADWMPTTDDSVFALALDASQRLYVAGQFSNVDAVAQRGVVRLHALDGTVDEGWNAQMDSFARAIAIESAGEILVGGTFTSAGGAMRDRIARLSAIDATADPAWNPGANDVVQAITVATDGAIFAGGSFTGIGGQQRAHIAKLSAATGTADGAWNPGTDQSVYVLTVAGADSIYAGGFFSMAQGIARPAGLARFSSNGSGALDTQWNPPLSGAVFAIAVDGRGPIYAAGSLSGAFGPQRFLYSLDAVTGAITPAWNHVANSSIFALVMTDSLLLTGGFFSEVMGAPRGGIAAIAIDRIFVDSFELP